MEGRIEPDPKAAERQRARSALEYELGARHDEARALWERLTTARARLDKTRLRTQEVRARTRHPRTDALHEAIRTRDVIGQAKGLLMAGGLSEDESFELLKAASQRAQLKVRTIAEEFVARTAVKTPPVGREGSLEAARRAAAHMDWHRSALATLADQRAQAVRDALGLGMSRTDVARALGVTPQAITKLLRNRT